VVLTVVGCVRALAPRRRAVRDTAAAEFSAARASAHVDVLATGPRPPGSPGHVRAREYLLAEPASLGGRVEVQQAVGAADRGTPGVQAVDDVAACVRAKKAQERGLRARKSSAISSNVAQRTPSWPLTCAINRSSMSST
jgi:hypothetical protein